MGGPAECARTVGTASAVGERRRKHAPRITGEAVAATLVLLERVPFAVLVVDSGSRILLANGAAYSLLSNVPELAIQEGRLRGSSGPVEARLQGLLARAGGLDRAPDGDGGESPYDGPCCQVGAVILTAVPLQDKAAGNGSRRRAFAVFLCNPLEPESSACHPALRLFGLTPAELRVAGLLGRGLGLASVARELNISLNSVRTHVGHIFQKTGMRRQAEFARFLARLAARLPQPVVGS